jgi:phage tail-like protein
MVGPPPQALEHAYKVYLGGTDTYLGTFLEISGMSVEYEVHEYPEGGLNSFVHKLRGRMKQGNLTLKSGVTNQQALLQWVLGTDTSPLGSAGQDLRIVFVTADGKPLRSFGFAQALPVRWTGPNASVGANQAATESLEIVHQGISQS